VLRRDPRIKQVITRFENAKEGEGDPSLFEEVNQIVDIEAMKCHRLLFPQSNTFVGIDFFAIVGLLRELGINQDDSKFVSLGSIRVGIAVRICFDHDSVYVASKHADESFRQEYIKTVSPRLSTTKVNTICPTQSPYVLSFSLSPPPFFFHCFSLFPP
jgi:hypothetical protein